MQHLYLILTYFHEYYNYYFAIFMIKKRIAKLNSPPKRCCENIQTQRKLMLRYLPRGYKYLFRTVFLNKQAVMLKKTFTELRITRSCDVTITNVDNILIKCFVNCFLVLNMLSQVNVLLFMINDIFLNGD